MNAPETPDPLEDPPAASSLVRVGCWAEIDRSHPGREALELEMTLDNPAYLQACNQGFSTRGIPRRLELFERRRESTLLPRALADRLAGEGAMILDSTSPGEEVSPVHSRIRLRPEQERFVGQLIAALSRRHGAIGQAPPGFGKTVVAIELIARMAVKTIVLVHKEFLLDQWRDRIRSFLEIEDDQIGIVQQDRCEWEGRTIVLAMAQSLLARDYGGDFRSSFGLVVVDEVHRFAAPTFQKSIVLFPARHRLGVTATPQRADGLEDVFLAHIGPIAAIAEDEGLRPRIIFQRTPVTGGAETHATITRRGEEDMVKVESFLVGHDERNEMIVDLMARAVSKGRKLLLLSGRREHLRRLEELLAARCRAEGLETTIAPYVGGMSAEERRASEGAQVLLGTYAMAKEGLDIPRLDTLFLATPRAEVLQAVGRILRPHAEKQPPVVIDLVDDALGLPAGLARKRRRAYERLGWIEPRARPAAGRQEQLVPPDPPDPELLDELPDEPPDGETP